MRATTIRRDEMTTIRRAFAALFLTALLLILMAGPARAVQVEIQTADGERPGDDALKQTFQSMETAIHNQAAAWKASFQFVSDFDDDLEVTCAFRLGQDETIDGFAYWNGEEKIVGEVLEKQAATEIYQKLTGVRRDPGILEQEGSTFRFRVYPVLPGETKPVELTGMSILEVREGVVEYTIPRENLPGKTRSSRWLSTSPTTCRSPMLKRLASTVSSNASGPRHVRVVYEDDGAAPDEDLRIRYRLDQDDYALRLIAHRSGDADGSFMLLVSPKQDADVSDVIGRDIVFVVDRSGSMDGVPLEQTKRALSFILDNLSRDDRFDVIAFDDENRVLFGSLQDATRKNRRLAIDEAEALESGGGTNIRDALMAALDELHEEKSDRARAIIFLTDGQGNNPPEVVLAEVRKRANGARIFPIGAGNGVNRRFLERLATDNRGLPTFVQNERRIEEEMRALYERIAMPLMVDLELSFEGVTVNSIYPEAPAGSLPRRAGCRGRPLQQSRRRQGHPARTTERQRQANRGALRISGRGKSATRTSKALGGPAHRTPDGSRPHAP
ncbi:MAG: VIT and VWA domain-containing protein [Deltaproteobacteria bacterium]|nr:VIT and VWA domain-containing protein [Deltaproteobacteria bacterium]